MLVVDISFLSSLFFSLSRSFSYFLQVMMEDSRNPIHEGLINREFLEREYTGEPSERRSPTNEMLNSRAPHCLLGLALGRLHIIDVKIQGPERQANS